jgi:hypothetical protein
MDLIPPPGIDLNESHQSRLYATYSSTYILAVIAVGLRLYCRLGVSKAGLWWDDYIICVALVWMLILHLSIYIAGILFFCDSNADPR